MQIQIIFLETHYHCPSLKSIVLMIPQACQQCIINFISTETLTAEKIKKETELDAELKKIKYNIVIGNTFHPTTMLQGGILFRGIRVITPKSVQQEMLQQLHSTHIGIVKMKAFLEIFATGKI